MEVADILQTTLQRESICGTRKLTGVILTDKQMINTKIMPILMVVKTMIKPQVEMYQILKA